MWRRSYAWSPAPFPNTRAKSKKKPANFCRAGARFTTWAPTLTHKRIIYIKCLKEGKTVEVTARETNHSPEAVTRYINDFKRVYACLSPGWEIDKISRHRAFKIAYSSKRLLLSLSAMKSSTRKAVFAGLSRPRDLAIIALFETILGWPRNLIARKFDDSEAPRKPGRRLTDDGISELMLTIVDDNPTWGYRHVWILY